MAGQSINDRLTAARYSLAGQGLAKSVCKATTEEVIGPKKKHLDYLLHCTNEPNVSIPQLANLLIERSQMQSWVSVFKALITVHHLMCYGNERFTQYLASSNCNFNLGGFLDKTGTTAGQQNQPQLSYDMSTFIRRYAKYINEKAISYRSVAFDFCKTKRGKDDGTLRTMPTDTLLKTLPILQAQLDALLDFDCTASELNNGVINSAFMLLFRDLIRLFACYNDGIINLLEKYFEMNKKQARDALDCYKKFLIRMDRVSEFLKVAEAIGMDKSEIPDLKQIVGIDKGEIPDLKKAPSSLLDALESHLASLEGKKITNATGNSSSGVKLKSAVSVLNSTSTSFGYACSNGRIGETTGTNGTAPVDEVLKRAALAEEEAMYEKLKGAPRITDPTHEQEHGKNNPFLSSPVSEPPASSLTSATTSSAPTSNNQIVDLFGGGETEVPQQPQLASKASDDLLQLGNPFADMLAGTTAPVVQPTLGLQQTTPHPYTNGFSSQPSSAFVSDNNFEAVFGSSSNNSQYKSSEGDVNPFADLGGPSLEGGSVPGPTNVGDGLTAQALSAGGQGSAFDGFGDILKPEGKGLGGSMGGTIPQAAPVPQPPAQPQKLISGDLDMSLSSLVENLNIKGPSQKQQWNSPKTQSKTGGTGWAPAISTGTTGYRPPQGAIPAGTNPPWQGGAPPVVNQAFPQQPQMGMMVGGAPQAPMSTVFPPPSQPATVGGAPDSNPASVFDPLAGL